MTLVGPLADPQASWPTPAIFVDRGNQFQTNHPLHISVGDGDSAARPVDQPLPEAKDFSDLAFALSQLSPAVRKVILLGFLGGRRDHEWMGLGETFRFLSQRTHPCACSFDGKIDGFSAGEWALDLRGVFSVLALKDTRLQLTGECRFQLPRLEPFSALSSHGLSNEGHGPVNLICEDPVFIFKNFSI